MSTPYEIRVEQGGRQVTFEGVLRPIDNRRSKELRDALSDAPAEGEICLDMKRLTHMNHIALVELARAVKNVAERRPGVTVRLVVSSVIPWAIPRFQTLASAFPNVVVDVYDRAMYPSQELIEDEAFVDILRVQDEIVWNLERRVLARHGLKEKMRVADVGCGVGGFATWLTKAFHPELVAGIDHSRTSLRAAQTYARQEKVDVVDFAYGEATSLLLPDDSFDFVSCRLVLQVSPSPDRVVRELFRICKPGGRVYVTNELLSSATGFPDEGVIGRGYESIVKVCSRASIDVNSGLRSISLLRAAGLEDVRHDPLVVDTTNTDRGKLAKVFAAWRKFFDDLGEATGADQEDRRRTVSGLTAHAAAALDPSGYAMWPVMAVSGRKPVRGA